MARARVSSPPASEHHEVTTNRPAKARPRRRSVKASEISQFDLNDRGSLQHWLALFIDRTVSLASHTASQRLYCTEAALLAMGWIMDGGEAARHAWPATRSMHACTTALQPIERKIWAGPGSHAWFWTSGSPKKRMDGTVSGRSRRSPGDLVRIAGRAGFPRQEIPGKRWRVLRGGIPRGDSRAMAS